MNSKLAEFHFLNQQLHLLPGKAIYWENKNALIISDIHLGKTDFFRNKGIAVPGGTTASDLLRLSFLLNKTGADKLIIIGDLLHSKTGFNKKTAAAVNEWREENKSTEIILIKGNHDKLNHDLLPHLRVNRIEDKLELKPFLFLHLPKGVENYYVLAGHVHPAVRLAGTGKLREKLACFYFGKDYGILPSFGGFTGNYIIEPEDGDKVFVIAEDEVVQISR